MLVTDQCRVNELGHSKIVLLFFMLHLSNVLQVVKSSERWLAKVISTYSILVSFKELIAS